MDDILNTESQGGGGYTSIFRIGYTSTSSRSGVRTDLKGSLFLHELNFFLEFQLVSHDSQAQVL